MYYVYIIYSKKLGKKYIGLSNDLKRRIKQHKDGQSRFTAKVKDWKLIYCEIFLSRKDASVEERFLKSGKGRDRLKHLLSDTMEL